MLGGGRRDSEQDNIIDELPRNRVPTGSISNVRKFTRVQSV